MGACASDRRADPRWAQGDGVDEQHDAVRQPGDHGEGCGAAGDAWGLGIILFWLLTLRAPFELPDGVTSVVLMVKVCRFDGTLEAGPAEALRSCGHPSALCQLAGADRGLLHPKPAERADLSTVLELLPTAAQCP